MDYLADKKSTSEYQDKYNQKCDCIYCENYYKAFSVCYPDLADFLLNEFGAKCPLEVINFFWNNTKDKRIYMSYYSIKGELYRDKVIVYDKDAVVTLYKPDTDAPIYGNTKMTSPYFILEISNIELPWILSMPPEG